MTPKLPQFGFSTFIIWLALTFILSVVFIVFCCIMCVGCVCYWWSAFIRTANRLSVRLHYQSCFPCHVIKCACWRHAPPLPEEPSEVSPYRSPVARMWSQVSWWLLKDQRCEVRSPRSESVAVKLSKIKLTMPIIHMPPNMSSTK